MTNKFKVVLTDYVWESIEIEKNILGEVADIVPLQAVSYTHLRAHET